MTDSPSPFLERLLRSEQETIALAGQLAALLQPGDCLACEGNLGTGKTAFIRAMVQALSSTPQEVVSPTFLLVQQYDLTLRDATPATLWHYDLYRLEDTSELMELALDDALAEGIVCIEWPEIAASLLPEDKLTLRITHGSEENQRHIAFAATQSSGWHMRLECCS